MTLTLWRWAPTPALPVRRRRRAGVSGQVQCDTAAACRQQGAGTEGQHYGRREKVVFTTIGNRLRIAGTPIERGFDTSSIWYCEAFTRRAKHHSTCASGDQVEYWTGLRPATPSNLPIIEAVKLKNLYLNTGHGTAWAGLKGLARRATLADIIAGDAPEVDYAFINAPARKISASAATSPTPGGTLSCPFVLSSWLL